MQTIVEHEFIGQTKGTFIGYIGGFGRILRKLYGNECRSHNKLRLSSGLTEIQKICKLGALQ